MPVSTNHKTNNCSHMTDRKRLKEKFSYVGRLALINVILGASHWKVINSLIKLRQLWRPKPDGRATWRNLKRSTH